MVEEMNWNWLGRIRNRTLVQQHAGDTWEPCKAFYAQATKTPTTLGPQFKPEVSRTKILMSH